MPLRDSQPLTKGRPKHDHDHFCRTVCPSTVRPVFPMLVFQLAKSLARYRSHVGPSRPKLEKESENEFSGPLGRGGPKSRKRSRKRVKIVEKQSILALFRLRFGLFAPRELIFRLFLQLWARRAQITPVASPRNPNREQQNSTRTTSSTILRGLGNGTHKNGAGNHVRIDDMRSTLNFHMGFPRAELKGTN